MKIYGLRNQAVFIMRMFDRYIELRQRYNIDSNPRLPFGLCKKYGIEIGDNWQPKDAWEALAEKGITKDDVFKDLDVDIKVSESRRAKARVIEGDIDGDLNNMSSVVEENTEWSLEHFKKNIYDLTPRQKKSVFGYTGDNYEKINMSLASGKGYGDPVMDGLMFSTVKEQVNRLTESLSGCVADEDMIVSHYCDTGKIEAIFGCKMDELKKESKGTNKAFCSCSMSRSGVLYNDVKMEIFVPKGTEGMYISGASKFPNEDEYLLQRGSVLKITSADYDEVENRWSLKADVIRQDYDKL